MIALQPAKITRAILVSTGKGEPAREELFAYTLIGPIGKLSDGRPDLDVPAGRQAWCDLDAKGRIATICYQDNDSDGMLDTIRAGLLPSSEPLGLDRLGPPRPIAPLRYRPAREDELPRFQLGYASCGGAMPDLRFATLVRQVTGERAKGSSKTTNCTENAALLGDAPGGGKLYAFGRFKVAVRGNSGNLTTSLIEGLSPGTILGHVRSDRPLKDAVAAKGHLAEQAALTGNKPFLHFTSAPTVATGLVKPGDIIIAGEVAHAITGRLASEVRTAGWFNMQSTLPAGTPVYGIPMGRSGGVPTIEPEVIWCAPQRGKVAQWTARCVPKGSIGYVSLAGLRPAFAITSLQFRDSGGTSATAPIVERGPVDFGAPLRATIRFLGWSKKHAEVSFAVAPAEADAGSERYRYERSSDGSVVLAIGGGRIRLRPASEDPLAASMIVEQPPSREALALPVGAARVN